MTKGNPFSAIFWVDASSESTVQKSFEVISERLKTQMDILLDTDARVNFVFRTLSDWPSPWFMVFDNYDNPTVFNNVEDYMPSNEQGMILVTSRNADADKLADEENQIQLPGLPESDAIELLLKQSLVKRSDQVASENAKEIVARLGHHALAITQAGAYISKRKILLGEFLDHFERRKDIILKETPQMSQYRRRLNKSERETSLSVFTTWELSFQQLEDEDTERVNMADILTLFAFFDCKDISEGLFKAYCDDDSHEAGAESSGEASDPETSDNNLDRMRNTPPSDMLNENVSSTDVGSNLHAYAKDSATVDEIAGKSQSYNERRVAQDTGSFLSTRRGNWDSDFFCDVLVTLVQLSLVQTFEKRADGLYHLSLHPLVRDWIRLRTKKSACREYSSIAATSIYRLLDSKSWNNRFNMSLSVRQELHAHIDVHEMNIGDFFSKDSLPDCAPEIEGTGYTEAKFGTFLYHDGQYEKSERWYRRSLDILSKQFGPEHRGTMTSTNNLALALGSQGKYKAAEAMHRRVLELSEKVPGPEHPDTLTSMNNLALTLEGQGKYEAAEAMHRWVLELKEKVLGPEHPDTLTSMNNLAGLLEEQGKHEAAEVMQRRALELREKVLGPEHPDTLTSMNNLALVLEGQGKYEAAEAMHRRVLELSEKVQGPEHPDTLTSMNNLALTLEGQGKYEAAEAMHRRVLELKEKVLGPENPGTLTSMNNLAVVLKGQGKYEAAEMMHRRELELIEKVLGPEHPDTLTSINNLAVVLRLQGKYEAAEMMQRRVLELREKVLGPEHPGTLTSMNNLAVVLQGQGKYEAAEMMHRRELELSEKVLGPEHPDTLTSMSNLALVLEGQGKYEAAEMMHRRELELIEKVLGPEHPDTLTSINNLAVVLRLQGKYEAAEATRRPTLVLDSQPPRSLP
jgi:tetratricopeptide (TPR) repeat protein